MFKIQPSLRHGFGSNYMPLDVSLNGVCDTDFHVMGAQPPDVVTRALALAIFDVRGRHFELDSNQRPNCVGRVLKRVSESRCGEEAGEE
jgi:hypothetical protein